MKAGASARTLAFPEHYFPVEGFSKVIDPLRARVLVLEQDSRCAILVLDMTSLPPEEIDALSGILKAETGAAYTVCLVTHTFSAPHFMPDGRIPPLYFLNVNIIVKQDNYSTGFILKTRLKYRMYFCW